jgi:type VI secretion system protein ImpG
MDPRLLDYYNSELAYLREMGAEFAEEFPKVAARLTMEGMEVSDPYVERLLEGFAFLMARLHLKVDTEFPKFTQNLLEIVYPDFLAPTPSMAMVEIVPDLSDANLAEGPVLAKGATFKAPLPRGETSHCQFTSAHPVQLWPLKITQAKYFKFAPDLPLGTLKFKESVRGGLRIKLEATAGLALSKLACDELVFHIKAPEETALALYEAVLAKSLGALVHWDQKGVARTVELQAGAVQPFGFEDSESLLPFDRRSFQGYRLLREYFVFPQRFLFFKVKGLARVLEQLRGDTCEIVLLTAGVDDKLEPLVDQNSLALFATPVANIFEQKADRVLIRTEQHEGHLVVDKTRPLDFEVYRILALNGFSDQAEQVTSFAPFYGGHHESWQATAQRSQAYFTLRRTMRMPSQISRRKGTRTGYMGTEVYISLVDENEAPFSSEVHQLSADVLATNRDLPLLIPIGGLSKLTLPPGLPMKSAHVIAGPTKPLARLVDGELGWRMLSHLTLNYESLFGSEVESSANLLRKILGLYVGAADSGGRRVIEAIVSLSAKPMVRRLPIAGPITFGRGLAIELTVSETGFSGAGAFLFGSVLERFFARHVTVNSFTQLTLLSDSRGEIARWQPRAGLKTIG